MTKILSIWKAEEAERSLQDTFAIHIKAKNGLHMFGAAHSIKSAAANYASPPERAIKMVGIGGSATDLAHILNKLSGFKSMIADILSNRDICSDLIINFLTQYIRKRFYDGEDETPIAVEFLLAEYSMIYESNSKKSDMRSFRMSMTHIDYKGEMHAVSHEPYIVVGRPINNPNWKKEMEETDWTILEEEEAKEKAENILGTKIMWLPSGIFTSFDDEEDGPTE